MKNYSTKITKNIQSFSTILLVEEAIRRGIKVSHINNNQREMSFLELSYKNHFEYIKGQNSSKTSFPAFYATENKAITRSLLLRSNISVAKGSIFCKGDLEKSLEFAKKIGYPVVIKPFDGCHGESVFMGLDSEKKCKEAIGIVFKKHKYALIEKEFNGKEHRFLASRNKIFAVANRDPANVVGDGIHTIRELIKIKNCDSNRGENYEKPHQKIKIDKFVKQNLDEQKIDLNYTPSKEEKIYLRKESNISTGGDSVDVTDEVHPELKKIVIKSVRAIPGLAYAGVDLLSSQDISKKPTKKSYIIIELNCSPGFDMQHFPYKGKPRDVAKGIFDLLFPETK